MLSSCQRDPEAEAGNQYMLKQPQLLELTENV